MIMHLLNRLSMTVIAALSVITGTLHAQPAAPAGEEAELLGVLRSDATLDRKAAACRRLSLIGTPACVTGLAALLGDEKLAHAARTALEPIPGPEVDAALRAALGTVTGLRLVGIIGSVGVRQDAAAVPALAALLRSDEAFVAPAAARALGAIGGAPAVDALEKALPGASPALKPAVVDGLLACAETLAEAGNRRQAVAIYDRLRALPDTPHQVKTAALAGAVMGRGTAGVPLLLEAVRGDDYAVAAGAAYTARFLPGAEVTTLLAEAVAEGTGLRPDNRRLLIGALADRGDPAAVPGLSIVASQGESEVRLAAIRALTQIGDPSVTGILAGLNNDADAEVSAAAREGLAALEGEGVDRILMAMLKETDPGKRAIAVDLLGQRRVASAVPALLGAARDPESAIRVAAVNVLGELAGKKEFPALTGFLAEAPGAAEGRALETALSEICRREALPVAANVTVRRAIYGELPDGVSKDVTEAVAAMVKAGNLAIEGSNGSFGDPAPGVVKRFFLEYAIDGVIHSKTVREGETVTIAAGETPAELTDELCRALTAAPAAAKPALLRVLRSARGAKALAAVRATVMDTNEDVAREAVSVLCDWPSPDALPDVLALAKAGGDQRTQILALRGSFRLIDMVDLAPPAKLAALQEVLALAKRDEEKRLGLAALGTIASPEALAAVMPYVDSAALKEEACLAAVSIAEKLAQSAPAPAAAAMQRVAKATKVDATATRAKAVLDKTR